MELTIEAPGIACLPIGARPERVRVRFRDRAALRALLRGDHLGLGQAYVEQRIDVDGDLASLMAVTDLLDIAPTWIEKLAFALRFLLRDRRRYNREAVEFHYDQPAEFFLPWFERWRSYSHGIYGSERDAPDVAQARKLQAAVDALRLEPGMEVFDMGAGWGSFVEYAGLQGIQVHAITISREQHRYVSDLIRAKSLPCKVEFVDFLDYEPRCRFQGAVFMGTLEHMPDYRRVTDFLVRHLEPEGRLWADFCSARADLIVGAFMRRYLWQGPVHYVDLPRLLRNLVGSGFNIVALQDDTLSYACTVRDWADALQRARSPLSRRFGEARVRAYELFLRGSEYFLTQNETQAYHLVAGRRPAPLPAAKAGAKRATATAPVQAYANRSPTLP